MYVKVMNLLDESIIYSLFGVTVLHDRDFRAFKVHVYTKKT